MKDILYVSTELTPDGNKILDICAVTSKGEEFHGESVNEFSGFAASYRYVCGYDAAIWDADHLGPYFLGDAVLIDTLPVSVLLSVKKQDSVNQEDPLAGAKSVAGLFSEELEAFSALPESLKAVYTSLLWDKEEFAGFFSFVNTVPSFNLTEDIRSLLAGRICTSASLEQEISSRPAELAYAIAAITSERGLSEVLTEVYRVCPGVDAVMKHLRGTPCSGCSFCMNNYEIDSKLREYFPDEEFRKVDGISLQKDVVTAAVFGKSFLAVFPTEAGKEITIKLPAYISHEAVAGLTVVITPDESSFEDEEEEDALLFLTPMMLHDTDTLEYLAGVSVSRIVIDEARCLSVNSVDYRVDYGYIAAFIKKLVKKKQGCAIPVSCFTQTSSRVIADDICQFLKTELGINPELYSASETHANLQYSAVCVVSEEERYEVLSDLLRSAHRPAVVYCADTKETESLTLKLRDEGFNSAPWNGDMPKEQQDVFSDAFRRGRVSVLTATKEFCPEDNVGLVVIYYTPASTEEFLRLAGRAGQDGVTDARCMVLSCEEDADRNFEKLNRSRTTLTEVSEAWDMIRGESAYSSGVSETAVLMLEDAGYVAMTGKSGDFELSVKADKSRRFKPADYEKYHDYYEFLTEQIHIADKFVTLLAEDSGAAVRYLSDSLSMKYDSFLLKYFGEDGVHYLGKSITPGLYDILFGDVSGAARDFIDDTDSQFIAALTGAESDMVQSVLEKAVSLLRIEGVKPEHLLILTFSGNEAEIIRYALKEAVGEAASGCTVSTFDSFDKQGLRKKAVLIISQAHRIGHEEYALIHALLERNEGMRVIAVGDADTLNDASSDSKYFTLFAEDYCPAEYDLA